MQETGSGSVGLDGKKQLYSDAELVFVAQTYILI
jgi:hypothetical protein